MRLLRNEVSSLSQFVLPQLYFVDADSLGILVGNTHLWIPLELTEDMLGFITRTDSPWAHKAREGTEDTDLLRYDVHNLVQKVYEATINLRE